MRILIKGYHYGENTPPSVLQYQKFGHDVKLLCMHKYSLKELYREHDISPLLSPSDIIIPIFNKAEQFFIKLSIKFNIPIGRLLHIRKTRNVINAFKPDVIIHHSLNYYSYICHKAYTTTHVGIPYSADNYINLKKKNKHWFFKNIFKNFDGFIFVLPSIKDFYIGEGVDEKKTLQLRFGVKNIKEIKSVKKEQGDEIRVKYSIPLDSFVFTEGRSLRKLDGGAFPLIDAFSLLNHSTKDYFLIFLKGILGKSEVIDEVQIYINSNYPNLKSKIVIVEKELDYKEYISHYSASNVFLSLLKNDQMGLSISEAILQNNLVILTDLVNYRNAFRENAFYVNPTSVEDILNAMVNASSLDLRTKNSISEEFVKWVMDADFEKNAEKRIDFYQGIIKGKKNEKTK